VRNREGTTRVTLLSAVVTPAINGDLNRA